MTDQLKVLTFPQDVVQRKGTPHRGEVLAWDTQLPIDQREFQPTHVPVKVLNALTDRPGNIAFWPQTELVVITRFMAPTSTTVRKIFDSDPLWRDI